MSKKEELNKIYQNYCKIQFEILVKTKGTFDPKKFDEDFLNLYGNNITFSREEVQQFIDEEYKKTNDLWENS